MKIISIIFIAITVLIGITACNPTYPPAATSTAATTNSGPYPTENQPTDSTYPVPQTSTSAAAPLITPAPGLSTVKGVLQLNGKPVPSAIVYLATTVKNAENQDVAAALNRTTAPTAVTNNNGSFIFVNVAVGRYALMYQGGPDTYLLYHPDRTEAILVEITGSENIDLGLLSYEDLPK